MLNKIMVGVGILLSFLLFYFCLNPSGNVVAKKSVESKPIDNAQKTLTTAVTAASVKKESPSFEYSDKDGNLVVNAVLNKNDENSDFFIKIDEICKNEKCKKDIIFKENKKDAKWGAYALSIINYFRDNSIENARLFIKEENLVIEGILPDGTQKDKLASLLKEFENSGFVINDKTIIKTTTQQSESQAQKVVQESIKNEVLESTVQEPQNVVESAKEEQELQESAKSQEEKVKKTETEIAKLLTMEPVRFKLNSFKITPESEKTLQKAIELLDSLSDDVKAEVAGYTDARGDKVYNLKLSQKRAEAVKAYLQQHMKTKKSMIAKGYGANDFIIPDNPNDKRNRRVEIHLKKGE